MNKRQKKKWFRDHPVQLAITAAELEMGFQSERSLSDMLNSILDRVYAGTPGKKVLH